MKVQKFREITFHNFFYKKVQFNETMQCLPQRFLKYFKLSGPKAGSDEKFMNPLYVHIFEIALLFSILELYELMFFQISIR